MTEAKARTLAAVMRTLKDERVLRSRDLEGRPHPDETALALGEAQRHFEELADE